MNRAERRQAAKEDRRARSGAVRALADLVPRKLDRITDADVYGRLDLVKWTFAEWTRRSVPLVAAGGRPDAGLVARPSRCAGQREPRPRREGAAVPADPRVAGVHHEEPAPIGAGHEPHQRFDADRAVLHGTRIGADVVCEQDPRPVDAGRRAGPA
jgi:hypothetical protein